ncbi:MAG TPA: hypothetical protein VFV38_17140 [Ktedonobacteraceae bacterium]|nr:hypothetical protein [Ktedonobacteraceae bacterium]
MPETRKQDRQTHPRYAVSVSAAVFLLFSPFPGGVIQETIIGASSFVGSRMAILGCALLPAAEPATDRAEVLRRPLRLGKPGNIQPLVRVTFLCPLV